MKLTSVIVLAGASLCVPAMAADRYAIDPEHTYPVFEVRHLGFSTQRGRFNKTSGTISLDRAAKSVSIDVSIDTNSIDMGFEKWDKHLRSEDFFNAAKFPTIAFKSTAGKFQGDVLTEVSGQLSLLGVTKPVILSIANFRCAPNPFTKVETCGADATVTIKRSEFGMSYGVPAIGDEVLLRLPVEAIRN